MIYGRWHSTQDPDAVTILRIATIGDVKKLERPRPNKTAKEAIERGSYVVVLEDGKERLYHQALLRADDGAREIPTILDALTAKAAITILGAVPDPEFPVTWRFVRDGISRRASLYFMSCLGRDLRKVSPGITADMIIDAVIRDLPDQWDKL